MSLHMIVHNEAMRAALGNTGFLNLSEDTSNGIPIGLRTRELPGGNIEVRACYRAAAGGQSRDVVIVVPVIDDLVSAITTSAEHVDSEGEG